MHRWLKTPKAIILAPLLLALTFILACGGSATAVPAAAVPAVPATGVPAVKAAPAATAVPAVKAAPKANATAVPQMMRPPAVAAATAAPQAKVVPAPSGIIPEAGAKYGGVLKTNSGTPGTWDVNQSPSSSVMGPVGPRLQGLMKMSPFDEGKTLLPGLATSWEVSDDGLLITFKIRDNVKFHDGTTMTVDDVVASWTRIHAPREGEISYRETWFSRINEVKAVDRSTVQFVFSEASAGILNFMASDWNSIFPKSVLEANNNDLKTLIDHPAAGPFKFAEIKAGELIRYEKFEDYWNEGLPYLDGIELHILGAGAFPAFLVGQLDTKQENNPENFELALEKGIQGYRAVVPDTHSMFFNLSVKPFDDVRVRKAMDLVIDRVDLEIAMAPVAVPGMGRWAPARSAWALPEAQLMALPVFGTDMEAKIVEATALMTEAGYPDGFKATMTVGSPAVISAFSVYAQAVLKENLNIDLEIETLDWSVWIARARETQFTVTVGAAFTTLHDPSDFMNTFWRTGGAQNWSDWSNAEFDGLMDNVDTEIDPVKRREFVYQAYEVLEREMPSVVGGWRVDGHMWWPYLHGFPVRGPTLGRYVYFDRQTIWLDK